MEYHAGQSIRCPTCGSDSSVAVKSRMDGWEKVGEYYACVLCGAELAEKTTAATGSGRTPDKAASRQLADFLGTAATVDRPTLVDDGERRFCRDCTQYLVHPFRSRCMRHDREVSPMDDCDDFERRALDL